MLSYTHLLFTPYSPNAQCFLTYCSPPAHLLLTSCSPYTHLLCIPCSPTSYLHLIMDSVCNGPVTQRRPGQTCHYCLSLAHWQHLSIDMDGIFRSNLLYSLGKLASTYLSIPRETCLGPCKWYNTLIHHW